MSIYWELFKVFFNVSCFTLGGGLAMLPLIEDAVVEKRKWVTKEEFLDVFGISVSMPGVMILNVATNVGYKVKNIGGAIVAGLGTILPPFLSIVLVGWFFIYIKDNPVAHKIFAGIRPAVIALLVYTIWKLFRSVKFKTMTLLFSIFITLAVVGLSVPSGYLIFFAVLIGMGYAFL